MCYSLTLKNFNKLVPEVGDTYNLASVVDIFCSGNQDAAVVVSKKRSPLGVIDCHELMKIILERKDFKLPNLADCPSLVKPIQSLPASLSVGQFCNYLASVKDFKQDTLFALVDEKGEFLGVLNNWQLTTKLLQNQQPENLLEQILEHIPLPLMWQDFEGTTLGQNAKWRLQIGDFVPEPDQHQVKLKPSRAYQRAILGEKNLVETLPYCIKESYNLTSKKAQNLLSPLWGDLQQSGNLALSSLKLEEKPKLIGEENKSLLERVWEFERVVVESIIPKVFKLIIATDTTEQQRLGTEVAAKNADLIQLNRLKDEFLACISHELKSPLTAILGLSSLLKDQKLGELNRRQARYSELIYQSGRQLMSLVNDLLDLTRLETGQLKLSLEQVNIQGVSDRVYQTLLEKHKEKITEDLEYTLEIDPDLTTLMADETRLRQMLSHLLDNAVKFTPKGGKMGLRINRWDSWIAFTVWDTGIAIPVESQHLLFEKFQQLENPLTRQFEGTGLGLVLTQRLAKVHGGDISFISQQGHGSEFTILLPSDVEKHKKSDNALEQDSNQLILIVETAPRYLERLTNQLNNLNYRYVIARTGTEALNKARQLQPHMILLNPLLPLLSGWDVLTLLKSNPSTQHIPVIITTNIEDKQKALQQGADKFLSLPIEQQALQGILAKGNHFKKWKAKNLTILYLHPPSQNNSEEYLDLAFANQLSGLIYRLLEAEDVEQGELLAQFWHIDVILFHSHDKNESNTTVHCLSKSETLANLPLITLDVESTQAANKYSNLNVFPCLVPLEQNTLDNLLKVIEIAIGLRAV